MKRGEEYFYFELLKNKFKIIFLCFSVFFILSNNFSNNSKVEKNYQITNEPTYCNAVTNNQILKNSLIQESTDLINENNIVKEWKLEIPKINLSANISEGTDKKTLDEFIGHFEESNKISGNICLAAHNRGYKVNYFEKLKELEIGDKIYYTYNENKRVYEVTTKTIIKDTEWEKLENTKDNRLTLITCVENEPQYRRCIQAMEFK